MPKFHETQSQSDVRAAIVRTTSDVPGKPAIIRVEPVHIADTREREVHDTYDTYDTYSAAQDALCRAIQIGNQVAIRAAHLEVIEAFKAARLAAWSAQDESAEMLESLKSEQIPVDAEALTE